MKIAEGKKHVVYQYTVKGEIDKKVAIFREQTILNKIEHLSSSIDILGKDLYSISKFYEDKQRVKEELELASIMFGKLAQRIKMKK
ncbi:hypothetical protein AB1I92_06220 [Bacillus mobilis]|uniref:hypothetical protein n=1 Tax=Bacillus cereus group TaxID=86661 RepID=UPI0022E5F9DD|nr:MULTISPECIES: hypothetical protein [unclassified Bacillus cereus group]HDR4581917.1 hypothetical protein [Bacillus cereus]MDA1615822.1 hypothetical protein [Bacillus cereus group sp. TH204-1LC]MDX5819869.1 hypothetical protein [Bacillus cereus group sp. BfR-BA-02490]MDX5881793.1 hypothetical protein [Bacillus cereus group sp. BfR-BA-00999]HDR4585071.1 hypothetical protein [Bacillus cereus]